MRTLSHSNPVIPHIAFSATSEDEKKETYSALVETIAQIVRWTVAGILLCIIAIPAIISISSSIEQTSEYNYPPFTDTWRTAAILEKD